MSEDIYEVKQHMKSDLESDSVTLDTGLQCLILIAQFHGKSVNPEQIRHAFAISKEKMTENELILATRSLGLKARSYNVSFRRLCKMFFPAIVRFPTGNYALLAKIENDQLLLLHPDSQKPITCSKEEFIDKWNGNVIQISNKTERGHSHGEFGIKWFIPSVIKYKKPLIEVLFAALLLQVLGVFSPMITQVVIDKVLVHKGVTTLDVLAIALISIAVFEWILSSVRSYIFTHTTSRIDVILGARLFKHLFTLPLRYFEIRRVGDTVARVRELENIRQFLTGSPLTSFLDVVFVFVYISIMLFYSQSLTVVVLVSLPLFVLLSVIVTPIFRSRLDQKFDAGAQTQSFLVESVQGIQTIKSFALEPEFQKKWESYLADYVKASYRTSVLSGYASSTGQFIQKATDIAILWVGAHLVMEGALTVGQFIAFRMLSGRVSSPVLRMVQLWQDFQQTGISIKRLGDIFKIPPEPSVDPKKLMLPDIKGDIRFEGVRFRYRIDGAEAVRNMSFHVRPGTIVGIVGRSGSGKSTISKLMQRLYIPESGKILIDGVDVSMADPFWLRRQVGVVLQENFLFNGSVRENISIHDPGADMERIINVAKIAGAHEFILELPEGYDTTVGERGTGLSGGQRQRVAIARALLTDPRVLIFDEATSALDYESENIIHKNLKQICSGRTVFIIAHRLSTLRDVSKIMTIDKGVLVEYGAKDELLKQKGLFYYLHSQQDGGR